MVRRALVWCGVIVVAGLCLAPQASGKVIPVSNWPVPDDAGLVVSALGMSDPVPFIAITPCRVVDTRGNGFTGEWGPPNLAPDESRDFTIAGQCGIPATGVRAVSFNFTVVSTGTGPGYLRVYPAEGTVPVVSTLNWVQWETKANAAVVPLGGGYDEITVNTSAGGAAVIIDVNGYYGQEPPGNDLFRIALYSGDAAMSVFNYSTTCDFDCAGYFLSSSTSENGAYALHGKSNGTAGGVMIGVFGEVASHTDNSTGTWGYAGSTTGRVYGVRGTSSSPESNSAGVLGVDGIGINSAAGSWSSAGVRGHGQLGVIGISSTTSGRGVTGQFLDPLTGANVSSGYLGGSAYGVYAAGNMGASGTKPFVEPHPTEANKVIRYVALEGREAGTYFRGKGQFVGRSAVIEVPEDFRMVTDTEGLTIQVTPIGDYASVAVMSLGLDRIELKATRDVEFYFLVHGVRRAYRDWEVVVEGDEYRPRSETDTMPTYLSAEARQRLIANGTYHEDGTVNLETAQRLGWVAAWRERDAAARAAAEANAARLRAQGEDTPKP